MRVRLQYLMSYALFLLIGVMSASAVLMFAQGPAQQNGQPAGQRGAAPQGQRGAQPAGPRGAAPIGPVPGARGTVMRLPPGALPPGAPHAPALPVDLFTTKNFYKDKEL